MSEQMQELPTNSFRKLAVVLFLALLIAGCRSKAPSAPQPSNTAKKPASQNVPVPVSPKEKASSGETVVLMHNVILDEPQGFKLRARWLRGTMRPTRPGVVPSFDDPNSFTVDVGDGVVALNLAEIATVLNSGMLKDSPLSNVSLAGSGQQLKLNGTLHKALPLPIEMFSDVSAASGGRIHLHVAKLRILKIPVTGLLNTFKVSLSDLVGPKGGPGIQISGDDLYLDPAQILPAPRFHGNLTDVHIGHKSGDLISVFGTARPDVVKVKQWRNFVRLRDGTISFGKLTMDHADLFLIDASSDAWFSFDLARYQEQLVNGKIQMTPQAGLRVFMPDIDKIPANAANRAISLQWLKNRNLPPPPDAVQ